eukprot:70288-Pleurochrysis_carterae.AAC.1
MAQAEAIQAEELGFIDRKFTHLGPPRDFQSVHPARVPAAFPDCIPSLGEGARPVDPSSQTKTRAVRELPATAVASSAGLSATDA